MPDMPMEKSPELEAVFKRVWQAFAEGSLDAISNMYSAHPGLLLILSDDANWMLGASITHNCTEVDTPYRQRATLNG
jgi:hypothetical protein